MPVINKGTSFSNGEQLTADKINDLIDLATFTQDATDSQTTTVNSAGQIRVNPGGISPSELSRGAPSWNATAGRLDVDGMLDGSVNVAGISINRNLSNSTGYAFLDLYGDNGTSTNQYVRLLNSNGNCSLENKKAGKAIELKTTDSSGTLRTGLKVDAAQNVAVRGDITGDSNTGRTAIFGGTNGNGANIELYAGSHNNGPNKAYYDASVHYFRAQNGTGDTTVSVRGQLHVKPIQYAANQDGYLLRGGANNNSSWDAFGIKLKTNSGGSPIMCASTQNTNDVMTWKDDKVGIGTIVPSATLTVNGSINYSGSLTHTSDRRLKENVNDLSGSLDKLARLNGKSYTLIDDEEGQTEFGFIAQEVEEVFPEVVQEVQQYELDENGEETTKEVNYLGVSYVQLIAPMVEAIKELKSQNETLEARIESLENA